MFDLGNIPIPGGIVLGGFVWVITSVALGDLVAERTVETSGWVERCPVILTQPTHPTVVETNVNMDRACSAVEREIGQGTASLCRGGLELATILLQIHPESQAIEQANRANEYRKEWLAELAPTRCSCAVSVVLSDRWTWATYAGTARVLGGPDDLEAELTRALYTPACAIQLESEPWSSED